MRNGQGKPSRVVQVLNFLLTLGLGASLATVAPRLWTRPAPEIVASNPPVPLVPPLLEEAPVGDPVIYIPPAWRTDSVASVIMANRGGIRACVERWRRRGQGTVPVKLELKLQVGISGRVVHVQAAADPRLRTLDPCIREVLSRWAFPPSDDRYRVEFAATLQAAPF